MAIDTSTLRMTFRDEFNSFSSSPGGSYGTWYTGGVTASASDNRNLNAAGQTVYYSDASVGYNPFQVSNGVLSIGAVKGQNAQNIPYSSGWIDSRTSFSQQYGYFEMRAKLPEGNGFWPAFWLVRTDQKSPVEIDIMEAVGREPDRVVSTLHSGSYSSFNQVTHGTTVAGTADRFHTYGVNWTPSTITFYVDGKETFSAATPADLKAPMYIIANLGVGADWGWGGAPDATTAFPETLDIDYIRAYANAYTTNVAGRAAIANAGGPQEITPAHGSKVVLGDGQYKVIGDTSRVSVTLGNGSTTVDMGGWGNSFSLGDGNHAVTLRNDGHRIEVGDGNSTIRVTGSSTTVVLHDTSLTTVVAQGYQQTIRQDGDGKVVLSGPTGATTVTLGDGARSVTLGGSGNTVTVGDGNSVIVAGTMNNKVFAGAGSSTITVAGWNNLVDAGPGDDTIIGGNGNSRYVLDWLGDGRDTVRGFIDTDVLDLGKALAGLPVRADLANIGDYVRVVVQNGSTTVLVDADRDPATAPVAVATLANVQKPLSAMLAWGNIAVSAYTAPPKEQPTPTPVSVTLDAGTSARSTVFLYKSDVDKATAAIEASVLRFGGAGGWNAADTDYIAMLGFGKGSTLTFDHAATNGMQVYRLHAAATGEEFSVAVQSLNGARLSAGADYAFF